MLSSKPGDVLEFWFGTAREGGAALEQGFKRWFSSSSDFDTEIENRYGALVEKALAGGLRSWETDVSSRLALIILLDQFPRNIFRSSPRAFAGDARALALAQRTLASPQEFKVLHPVEKMFLLMPFQHVEEIDLQEEGVALFRQLEETASDQAQDNLETLLHGAREFAELHRDIIRRFGRFPHRNAVLGRENTAEEQAWLDDDAPRFGQ